MFDFEQLIAYKKAKFFNKEVLFFIKNNRKIDCFLKDQLKRASISTVINIAEGSGRFTQPDKRNFYIIARGSTYETASIIDILHDDNLIAEQQYTYFYLKLEEISKILLGLINSTKKSPKHEH